MWTGPVCSQGQHLDETAGDSELTPSSDRRRDHRQRERTDQRSENRIALRHSGLTGRTRGRHQAASHLDDFLHPRRADHVGVRVEANLVHNGAVALQDHEGPVHHATRASFKREPWHRLLFLSTPTAQRSESHEKEREEKLIRQTCLEMQRQASPPSSNQPLDLSVHADPKKIADWYECCRLEFVQVKWVRLQSYTHAALAISFYLFYFRMNQHTMFCFVFFVQWQNHLGDLRSAGVRWPSQPEPLPQHRNGMTSAGHTVTCAYFQWE